MYINPNWRILTIGDGDLSFSASLLKNYKPKHLTATVLDDIDHLTEKYGAKYLRQLKSAECRVLSGFDVTKPSTWIGLEENTFDAVIFQFPLIPAFNNEREYLQECDLFSVNTLNRRLLRLYLLNSFKTFLAKEGARLAFITSKDVKPYLQWDIEEALTMGSAINFTGKLNFNIEQFPDYHIRNVNRDKHVKSTRSITYIYSDKEGTEVDDMVAMGRFPKKTFRHYCHLCKSGPFGTEHDKQKHLATRKHLQMALFDQQWQNYLQGEQEIK